MSVVTATIKSNGEPIEQSINLIQLEALYEVNRIPSAQLVLSDGSIPLRQFAVSQSAFFNIGKEIEILLRYEGDAANEARVFRGIVTGQTVESNELGNQLTVDLKDPSVKMSSLRKTKLFRNQNDSEVFSDLIEANGLKKGTLDETPIWENHELVQYNSTDWDFLLLRAEANGLFVTVKDGIVSATQPRIDSARQTYEFGMSEIYALEMRADAERQSETVKTSAWNVSEQTMTSPESGDGFTLYQGENGINPAKSANAVGATENKLFTTNWRQTQEMAAWAKGRLMRSRLSLHRGW